MDIYNPIRYVNGAEIPTPSTYVYNLQDISASDAGRTQDGKMQKNRIGQSVKLEVSWQNVKTSVASQILRAFDNEYVNVTYLDLKSGTYKTKEFYTGDKSAPSYNTRLGVWQNVSFNLVERDCS